MVGPRAPGQHCPRADHGRPLHLTALSVLTVLTVLSALSALSALTVLHLRVRSNRP